MAMLFLSALLIGCPATPPSDDPVLLQIGDSLTWRATPTYPVYLPDLSPPYRTVGSIETADGLRVEGHGGYTTAEILLELPSWAVSYDPPPTECLVLLGLNDVGEDVPIETIIGNLGKIDQFLVNNFDCDVRIGLNPSQSGTYTRLTPGVEALNQAILRTFDHAVDLHTDFDAEALLDDGLHPNDSGAHWMAERWADALWQ